MKERPILFSGAMVRALLDGSKTHTRRIVKVDSNAHLRASPFVKSGIETTHGYEVKNRYGTAGDQLWVRESGIYTELVCPNDPTQPGMFIHDVPTTTDHGHYWIQETRAHGASYQVAGTSRESHKRGLHTKVVPSIHMPRWASRIQLEITGVRVERLQDISEQDAVAEGIGLTQAAIGVPMTRPDHMPMPIFMYKCLWESLNGPGSWDANPWVWVIEFKRLKP